MLNKLKKYIFTLFNDVWQSQKDSEIKETEVIIDTAKEESEPIVKRTMSGKKKKKS